MEGDACSGGPRSVGLMVSRTMCRTLGSGYHAIADGITRGEARPGWHRRHSRIEPALCLQASGQQCSLGLSPGRVAAAAPAIIRAPGTVPAKAAE